MRRHRRVSPSRPPRAQFLPFHRPAVGEEEIAAVVETLRSGWLTSGPRVERFEEAFRASLGSSHAVALSSCTAALHLALVALGVGPGDEVIVPTMTFTATAEVATYLGARPVLADCRRDTFNIDEALLESRIGARTKVVIPVHMAGHPCAMDSIVEMARARGIKVVEDAAHALPAKYLGRNIGKLGDIGAFSFYATKPITTGEGGMAVTESAPLADRMRVLRLHGMSKDAASRYASGGSWYYEVTEAGFKYNMSDIAAAMGEVQLRRAGDLWERRAAIAARYGQLLGDVEGVRLPVVEPRVQHAWHLYIVLLDLDAFTIDRARFIQELSARNIGASVHFIPLHLQPYYQRAFGYRKGDFPNAEWVYERCVSLPIYPGMTDEDVEDVAAAVRDVARECGR